MERYREIEKSIITTFRGGIWRRFISAVVQYRLIEAGDRIAVCISGGKDSMLMAKCVQELQRHGGVPFEASYIAMDPGYRLENRRLIINNALEMNIPLTIFKSDIFRIVEEVSDSPCYLCARMRRGFLYHRAQELGCNKIALGHHFNDVVETILMGMLYGAQVQTMMPKLHSANFPGMELIRPMYLVREEDVVAWRKAHSLSFLQCACRFTENAAMNNGHVSSKRGEIKELIREMKKTNPNVDANIFRSVENVNLSTVISYKKDGIKRHFLDGYNEAGRAPEDNE